MAVYNWMHAKYIKIDNINIIYININSPKSSCLKGGKEILIFSYKYYLKNKRECLGL